MQTEWIAEIGDSRRHVSGETIVIRNGSVEGKKNRGSSRVQSGHRGTKKAVSIRQTLEEMY